MLMLASPSLDATRASSPGRLSGAAEPAVLSDHAPDAQDPSRSPSGDGTATAHVTSPEGRTSGAGPSLQRASYFLNTSWKNFPASAFDSLSASAL